MDNPTIEQLVAARIPAKRAEDAAIAHRREIDAAIAAKLPLPADKDGEGTASQKFDDGLKLSIVYGLTRKVSDEASLKAAWEALPAAVQGAFRWKPEVDVKALKALSAEDRLAAAKFIEAKPSTPSVKLEIA